MTFEKADPKLYFYEVLYEALNRLHFKVEHWTENYLVELLTRQIEKPPSAEPLVLQMAAALEAKSLDERFARFKEMGDSSLLLVGFYEEWVSRRGVTRNYIVQMGGNAYRSAAPIAKDGMSRVYITLSDGFEDFVRLFDEVKELTSGRTPQDVVKLYEKWRRTGSNAAMRRLQENGVFPSNLKGKG